ncbi:hypothetical protein PIB30_116693 [Stylosanthes scabra]|uniref:Uncharacterized protein n=1 Tax=Stylosanthes scabra TaxID=79078 RepID=A0ABU6SB04_9FABA|nr:hypothetical protein [Stylosanthes scabra]
MKLKKIKQEQQPVENNRKCIKIEWILQEELQFGRPFRAAEPHHRRSRHPIPQNNTAGPTGGADRLASPICAGNEAPLRRRHRHNILHTVEKQRPRYTYRNLNVAHRHLTTLPQNRFVIEPFQWQTLQGPPGDALQRVPANSGGAGTITETRLKRVRRCPAVDDRADDLLIVGGGNRGN